MRNVTTIILCGTDLINSNPNASESEHVAMHKLALSIILTSQGISFLHAGTEFLRNKKGVENSYKSPDSINEIDWSLKTKHLDVFNYVKSLIRLRKGHPAFKMTTGADIRKNILFFDDLPSHVIGYEINGAAVKDSWHKIQVWFNGGAVVKIIYLQDKGWKSAIENNYFSWGKVDKEILLQPYSCTILYSE